MTAFAALPPVERARRIANSLLALLPADERTTWTERAHAVGETWLGATLITYSDDQALTTRQAAQLLCVSETVIRQWACQPHPTRPGRPLLPRAGRQGRQQTYLVRCLLDASAAVRRGQGRRFTKPSRVHEPAPTITPTTAALGSSMNSARIR